MATELYAAGRVIGFKCFDENYDFLKCKVKDKEPSACAAEGEAVHKCVFSLYKEIGSKASAEFSALARCLDDSDLQVGKCKKLQQDFESAFYRA